MCFNLIQKLNFYLKTYINFEIFGCIIIQYFLVNVKNYNTSKIKFIILPCNPFVIGLNRID